MRGVEHRVFIVFIVVERLVVTVDEILWTGRKPPRVTSTVHRRQRNGVHKSLWTVLCGTGNTQRTFIVGDRVVAAVHETL